MDGDIGYGCNGCNGGMCWMCCWCCWSRSGLGNDVNAFSRIALIFDALLPFYIVRCRRCRAGCENWAASMGTWN